MKRLLSLVAGAALVLALPVQAAAETMDASMAPSGMALVGDTLYVADVCRPAGGGLQRRALCPGRLLGALGHRAL